MKLLLHGIFSIPTTICLVIAIILGTGIDLNDWYYWVFVGVLFIYGFLLKAIREYLIDRLNL